MTAHTTIQQYTPAEAQAMETALVELYEMFPPPKPKPNRTTHDGECGNAAKIAGARKRMDRVVELAKERGSISTKEAAEALDYTPCAVVKYMRKLCKAGRLKRVGHSATTRYLAA